ncbi:hypothetical protein ACFOQM_08675 [Paenibacillus sp. GCM10012307]|uniref:Uncharacterized protein n=1 Tax=Paenibacillus roseus TaxID=2798579 RepID=A0A934MKR8_9BACL|nr:hypothetical protein [Paenibacillus roseus]MBJ6361360.1 hypothetical protein [Paenibacillus roseus]
MQTNSRLQEHGNRLRIYLLAGIATAPHFFGRCCDMIAQIAARSGWEPIVETIFPYGDDSRSLFSQVREVSGDLPRRMSIARKGGRIAASQIRNSYSGEPLVLIGHSGGGAAAYQAARILSKEQELTQDKCRIVQIGSPKVPIVPELARQVYYIHAVDDKGRAKDPITRLGSWGGWSLNRFNLPGWNPKKYAPAHIEGIHLLGGHTDYLRYDQPFIDEQQMSNMEKTLERVWGWIQNSLALPQQ